MGPISTNTPYETPPSLNPNVWPQIISMLGNYTRFGFIIYISLFHLALCNKFLNFCSKDDNASVSDSQFDNIQQIKPLCSLKREFNYETMWRSQYKHLMTTTLYYKTTLLQTSSLWIWIFMLYFTSITACIIIMVHPLKNYLYNILTPVSIYIYFTIL